VLLDGPAAFTYKVSMIKLLSQHFDKRNSTALPIWNGCSQFGDFIALFISDIIVEGLNARASVTLLVLSAVMIIVVALNAIFLPKDATKF
jgi:sugar phosphate permease